MADKLFGTADTGLINAAYKAAMANVPADLSGVYDKVVKSHGDFMKKVGESADELFADIEKYDQEMKNTFQPIYESMENGTYTDADILSFQNQISSFRDEWKSIPKGKAGDDARLLWKSKVGKFKNDVVSMNQTLTNLSYIVANEEHIALDNPEDAQFLAAIGRLHSGEEGLKATKIIKDGRVVYQVNINGKVIEKNQDDIKKLVSPKDYTAISNLETQLDLAKQMPSSGYTTYDGDGAAYIARNIYNSIKSAGDGKSKLDAYRTLANYRYAGGKTFREAIYQDDLLSSVLSTSLLTANLPSKFDINSDGKVDKTDLLNKENYNALANYILKTPGVGGQLLANWYAASEGSKIFNRANQAYKAKIAKQSETKTKTDRYHGYGQYSETSGHPLSKKKGKFTNITATAKYGYRTDLLNRESFEGEHFYYDIIQNQDGSFTANALHEEGGDIVIENISGSEISRIEGLLSRYDESRSIFNFPTSARKDKNKPPKGTRGLSVADAKKARSAVDFKNIIVEAFGNNVLDVYKFDPVTERGKRVGLSPGVTTITRDKVVISKKDGTYSKVFDIGKMTTEEIVIEINNLFSEEFLPLIPSETN